ncbi:unnamed protein product, partial [Aureobasidium vineae]
MRLSCPSTGLDLALTSNASISTLAQSCNTPSITHIESGRPSQFSSTCLFLAVSLTTAPLPVTNKKAPTHRLGKDVPFSHLKPPEGLSQWTLDQVHLKFDITSPSQSSVPENDAMLFECSTILEDQANVSSSSLAGTNNLEGAIGLIDAALRLALANLTPKALMNIKITERSSFKHLDEVCPAMWNPVLLPTISHALSNSISRRARSFSLKEKLKEISRQECPVMSNGQHTEPLTTQKAVSIRLWRLMQRRLRDPSAGKRLKSILISDAPLSTSEQDEDIDNSLSFEHGSEHSILQQSENCLGLDDADDEEDLLEIEYESECENLFRSADLEPDESPSDDEMLDCLHNGQHDNYDQVVASDIDDETASVFEDMLEL